MRGRELPGFMSTQAFYQCMSVYVEHWAQPMREIMMEVHAIAQEVSGGLADVLIQQYPALRDCIRQGAATVLANSIDRTKTQLENVLSKERDPFTLNDFLQQWVNKLRFDKFSEAVDVVFDNLKSPATN